MAWYDFLKVPNLFRRDPSNNYPSSAVAMKQNVDKTGQAELDDVRVNKEHGATGDKVYSGLIQRDEYNPKWQGAQSYDTIAKMRKGDGSVKAALSIMKLPLHRAEVKIAPNDEETTDATDLKIAETCQRYLLQPGVIKQGWAEQLANFLLFLDYGFSVTEKIWDQDELGVLYIKSMAPRLPTTIEEFKVDKDGSLKEVWQRAAKGASSEKILKIPAPIYTCVMSWDKEGANYWGNSVLRVMYKHWFYKEEMYRIDAIRYDRWGIGIPDAEIAKDYNMKTDERGRLEAMLQSLRGGEYAYTIHPEQIKLKILTPEGTAGEMGIMNSILHHDLMIYRAILAHFIATGNSAYGNYGTTRSYMDMFFFAEQVIANFIEENYNLQIIKPFCDYNFDMNNRAYPKLKFADLQKFDMGLVSESLARFAGNGVITPDDDLEDFMRKTYGWPKLPKEYTRKVLGTIGQSKIDTGAPGDGGENNPDRGRPPRSSDRQDRNVDDRRSSEE